MKNSDAFPGTQGGHRVYNIIMTYKVSLKHSEEGVSVWVPGLPGCCSQGVDEREALVNIQDAIHDYLEVARELAEQEETREVEVPA